MDVNRLPRKSAKDMRMAPVPQTDTRGHVKAEMDFCNAILKMTEILLPNLLKQLSYSDSKKIKPVIKETQQLVSDWKDNPNAFNLRLLCKPFFMASETLNLDYEVPCLDFYAACFQFSDMYFHPSFELSNDILTHCLRFNAFTHRESFLKMCKVISNLFLSSAGVLLIHGDLIKRATVFLLRMHAQLEDSFSVEAAEMTLHEIVRVFVSNFTSKMPVPVFSADSELVDWICTLSINLSLTAIRYPPCRNIWEVDIYCLICALSQCIQDPSLPARTLYLAANVLNGLLSTNFPFFDTPGFASLLKSEIHIALLTLALDFHPELAIPTARLLITVWQRFASLYVEGLSDVIESGITTPLSSPNITIVTRGCLILKMLSDYPQIFIDLYVNYDCDDTGTFRNVFQRMIEALVSRCYHDPGYESLQKYALTALVKVIGSLWNFYADHTVNPLTNPIPRSESDEIVGNDRNDQIKSNDFNFNDANGNNQSKESALKLPRRKRVNGENESEGFSSEYSDIPLDTNLILKAKETKNILQEGIVKFKDSPWKGIKFLQDHGLIGDTPDKIAQFLYNTNGLDPIKIGEVIGGHKNNAQAVLLEYVHLFDFRGKGFEQAFREFLSKFQIPGEAQMIDRIMEQFGSKYTTDNPGIFSSADTVYVLGYSALMLHTDAHNPHVKNKMDLRAFINNNRGIDNGKDLPEDFLTDLYNGITSQQIFATSSHSPSSPLLTRAQKTELYDARCKETLQQARQNILMLNQSQTSISSASQMNELSKMKFRRTESPLLLRPMFSAIWGATLAVFSLGFEETEYSSICLNGLTICTHIASHCYVENALEALIDAFAKFTRLGFKDFQEKNFNCSCALLHLADEDMPYLKGVWGTVLSSISSMNQLEQNQKIIPDLSLAESILERSHELDSELIKEFCEALCKVSSLELNSPQPHYFMLSHIAEIAAANMKRPKIEWVPIWDILGSYLAHTACSPDLKAAGIAINSLKRTAIVFLGYLQNSIHSRRSRTLSFQRKQNSDNSQNPEISQNSEVSQNCEDSQITVSYQKEENNYHYEMRLLNPFFEMMSNLRNMKLVENVILIIEYIYRNFGVLLSSGWMTVLQIFSLLPTIVEFRVFHDRVAKDLREIVVQHFLNDEIKNEELPILISSISIIVSHDEEGLSSLESMELFTLIAQHISISGQLWETLFDSIRNCSKREPFASVSILLNIVMSSNDVSDDAWNSLFENYADILLEKVDQDLKCGFVETIFSGPNLQRFGGNKQAIAFLERGVNTKEEPYSIVCKDHLQALEN